MPHSAVDINSPPQRTAVLSRATSFAMACACATSVANVYYNQPLLSAFAKTFHTSVAQAGLVATAAQVGYAAGLLGFVPLGDVHPRKKIVVGLACCCMTLLALTASSRSLSMLVFLQFLVGVTAVSPQLLIPLAVELVGPDERGRIVGYMMAGLLTGLLLARTVSGFVADTWGWAAMFWIAAGLMLITALALQFLLPSRPAPQQLPYMTLIRSLWMLVCRYPALRSASLLSALSFASFCGFWAVLSFLMKDQFQLGATQTGYFGVVGLAGALCAPLAGRLSDRRGAVLTIAVAIVVSITAFVGMYLWLTMTGLVLGVILLDLGVQSTQVAAQVEVISLAPEARNRLNTVYMVSRFVGGAAGSAAGTVAYAHSGWEGTCFFCISALLLSLAVHVWQWNIAVLE
jgi:predicted MFS family arabinose efflux permease